MQIQVHFVFDNADEYAQFSRKFIAPSTDAGKVFPASPLATPPEKTIATKAAPVKQEAKVAEDKPVAVIEATYDGMKKLVLDLAKATGAGKGKSAAVAILKDISGHEKVGPDNQKPEHYAPIIEACQKALAA